MTQRPGHGRDLRLGTARPDHRPRSCSVCSATFWQGAARSPYTLHGRGSVDVRGAPRHVLDLFGRRADARLMLGPACNMAYVIAALPTFRPAACPPIPSISKRELRKEGAPGAGAPCADPRRARLHSGRAAPPTEPRAVGAVGAVLLAGACPSATPESSPWPIYAAGLCGGLHRFSASSFNLSFSASVRRNSPPGWHWRR